MDLCIETPTQGSPLAARDSVIMTRQKDFEGASMPQQTLPFQTAGTGRANVREGLGPDKRSILSWDLLVPRRRGYASRRLLHPRAAFIL